MNTPYLAPRVQGLKRRPEGFRSLSSAIWLKLYSTPNLVGIGHLIGPQIRIWKDLGLVCFWSHGVSLSSRVFNTKVIVNVPNSAWPQGQGIGLHGPAGPWKANVWLTPHTFVIKF